MKSESEEHSMEEINSESIKLKATKINYFVCLLIKIRFLPIRTDSIQRVSFKFLSFVTFICFLSFYGTTIATFILCGYFFWLSLTSSQQTVVLPDEITDYFTHFGFNVSSFFLFPLLPVILGHAAS